MRFSARARLKLHALFEPVDRPPYIRAHGFSSQAADRWRREVRPQHVRRMYEYADINEGDITVEHRFEHEVYVWAPFTGCGAHRIAPVLIVLSQNEIVYDGVDGRRRRAILKEYAARAIAIARLKGGPAADWKPLALDPSK